MAPAAVGAVRAGRQDDAAGRRGRDRRAHGRDRPLARHARRGDPARPLGRRARCGAVAGPDRLRERLPHADVVVLTAPLTRETRGLIGEAELRAMRPSAYLINIGRGGTVDEPALVRALREGWIAGAALDVFAQEPLPEDSPLWEMEQVIITGHYAGMTPRYNERAMAILLDNLRRYRAGEELRNVVDKQAGY
nr:MAG: hypothetical protein DIU80_09430 [Chloroflexota bacterium]